MDKSTAARLFPKLSRATASGYAIALIAFLVSFLLRAALDAWMPDRGVIVFLPAILLVAYVLDWRPAVLTLALSAVSIWYFFLPPHYSFGLTIDGVIVLATFLVGSAVGIALVHRLRVAISTRDQAEERIAADLRDMTRLNLLSNQLVREGGEIEKSLIAVLDTAIAVTEADKGNVQLVDSNSGVLTIAAQRGLERPFLKFFEYVRDDASACAAAMRSGARVIVENVQESEIFAGQPSKDVLITAGVRAVISTPLMSSGGNLLGMISIHFGTPHKPEERELHLMDLLTRQTADYLERKRAEEIQDTLIREIQHRGNNLLTVIQAIANRSLSGDYSLPQAKAALEARLQALARANRQLMRSNWSGAGLNEIVRSEMQPFAERMVVDGGTTMLSPKHAQNFSLALHELATNATKHGALSNGSGKVGIFWTTVRHGKTSLLKFRWQERGGPPVNAPTRQGFGTALLKATFPDARVDYAAEGFTCEIDVLLGEDKPSPTDAP